MNKKIIISLVILFFVCISYVSAETVNGLPEEQTRAMKVNPQFTPDGYQKGIGLPEYQIAVESGDVNSPEWQNRMISDMYAGGDSGADGGSGGDGGE